MHLGIVYASLAFVWWGLFPLYFRIVAGVPPGEVLAHRIVWCVLFVLALLGWRRQWAWLPGVLRAPKVLGAFVVSALLIVVRKPGAELTRDDLLAFFDGRIAKWWTPDDVVFVDAIPLGATGKMLKNRLRDQYGDALLKKG